MLLKELDVKIHNLHFLFYCGMKICVGISYNNRNFHLFDGGRATRFQILKYTSIFNL